MPIIRKGGGISGKICDVCEEWKMLGDFPLDEKSKKFKGYRKPTCQKCLALAKVKQKKV